MQFESDKQGVLVYKDAENCSLILKMVYLRPRRTPLEEEINKTKFDLCFTSTSFKTFSLDRLEAIQTEFRYVVVLV